MAEDDRMPTTTTRSAHIGQPGYDTEWHWRHFLDKYEARTKRKVRKFIHHHQYLLDDAWSEMKLKIFNNPLCLAYEPPTHFRTVLIREYIETFRDLVRKEKETAGERYVELTSPLQPEFATQEDERKRMIEETEEMVRRTLIHRNYENFRFGKKITEMHFEIWKDLQKRGATPFSVAANRGEVCKLWKVYQAQKRLDDFVTKEAAKVLVSMGVV